MVGSRRDANESTASALKAVDQSLDPALLQVHSDPIPTASESKDTRNPFHGEFPTKASERPMSWACERFEGRWRRRRRSTVWATSTHVRILTMFISQLSLLPLKHNVIECMDANACETSTGKGNVKGRDSHTQDEENPTVAVVKCDAV